jgi:hypothetical protein
MVDDLNNFRLLKVGQGYFYRNRYPDLIRTLKVPAVTSSLTYKSLLGEAIRAITLGSCLIICF